jgi:hypothetical protein
VDNRLGSGEGRMVVRGVTLWGENGPRFVYEVRRAKRLLGRFETIAEAQAFLDRRRRD